MKDFPKKPAADVDDRIWIHNANNPYGNIIPFPALGLTQRPDHYANTPSLSRLILAGRKLLRWPRR